MNADSRLVLPADVWRLLFGNDAPVEVEIGSGDGVFLAAWAAGHPERNCFGIERSPAKARRLEARLATRGLANVQVLRADATCVVATLLPAASVAAYHVYFPDPWPKRAHAARRIFTPAFVDALARTLIPAGRLHFATDVAAYANVACGYVLASGRFRALALDEPHPGLATSFARKYRYRGRALHTFTFERADASETGQRATRSKMRSM